MKNYKLLYNEYGYLAEPIQTDECYIAHQENNSVSISATFPGILVGSVNAYVEFPGGGDIIECEKLAVNNHTATVTLSSDHLRYHYLLVGFEVDTGTKQIRFEPVTLEIDKFVNPTGSASPSAYTVTVKIGNVMELEPGETPIVTNSGTDKHPVLNFGIPRGYKGDKGDKGDKGEKGDPGAQGVQGVQGIQGIPGKDGYTPVKGKDYFTAEDIASLGIDKKVDKEDFSESNDYFSEVIGGFMTTTEKELAKKIDKVSGKGLSSNDFTDDLKIRLENNTFDGYIGGGLNENDGTVEEFDFDSYTSTGIYKLYEGNTSDDIPPTQYILCVDTAFDKGWTKQSLICLSTGEIKTRIGIGEEWKKISVSQTDLDNAIGDIETSLENIIQKYGLGGDGV